MWWIAAWRSIAPLDRGDTQLVIAGATGWLVDNMLRQSVADDAIVFKGFVGDDDLAELMCGATAFVYPSLYEGFGLPVVEAMSLGKPVFLSNLTSLPEVGGVDAHYWKSFDPQSMIAVFENGMRDFNEEKSKRSIEWSKQFSWENATQAYLKLYEDI